MAPNTPVLGPGNSSGSISPLVGSLGGTGMSVGRNGGGSGAVAHIPPLPNPSKAFILPGSTSMSGAAAWNAK